MVLQMCPTAYIFQLDRAGRGVFRSSWAVSKILAVYSWKQMM